MGHAEASAKTIEAAVAAAAAQLGLPPHQVDIEVLEDPVPSTFGYIGTPARVRVTPRGTTPEGSAGIDPEATVVPSPAQPPTPSEATALAAAGSSAGASFATSADSLLRNETVPSGLTSSPSSSQMPEDAPAADSADVSAMGEQATTVAPEAKDGRVAGAERIRDGGSTTDVTLLPSGVGAPSNPDAAGVPPDTPTSPGQSRTTRSSRRTYRDKDEPIEPQMVEEDTERAGDFLEGLLDALDVDGDITTWIDEAGGHIDLEGPELDVLVGVNGETLDSLQELTRLAVLRQSKRRVRLLIDINGFRAHQREQLTAVVKAAAELVLRTREDHEFQPMSPAERKVVHDAVATIDGVRTESLGEEPARRVVIRPT